MLVYDVTMEGWFSPDQRGQSAAIRKLSQHCQRATAVARARGHLRRLGVRSTHTVEIVCRQCRCAACANRDLTMRDDPNLVALLEFTKTNYPPLPVAPFLHATWCAETTGSVEVSLEIHQN